MQLIYSTYYLFVGNDQYSWISFIASLLFAIGSGLFVYTSYPNKFFSRYWWCLLTFQKEEQLEFGPEMNRIMNAMMAASGTLPEESKPLL